MMQDKYYIELRNKTNLPVTASQAEVIDKAWQAKAIVKIGDSKINSVDIVGIWDADTWYDNHPEDRPTPSVPFHDRPALPPATKSSRYDLWMEATKRNRDRIKKGIQPYANWRVTTEGELIEDPEYYKTKVAVLSDYR